MTLGAAGFNRYMGVSLGCFKGKAGVTPRPQRLLEPQDTHTHTEEALEQVLLVQQCVPCGQDIIASCFASIPILETCSATEAPQLALTEIPCLGLSYDLPKCLLTHIQQYPKRFNFWAADSPRRLRWNSEKSFICQGPICGANSQIQERA